MLLGSDLIASSPVEELEGVEETDVERLGGGVYCRDGVPGAITGVCVDLTEKSEYKDQDKDGGADGGEGTGVVETAGNRDEGAAKVVGTAGNKDGGAAKVGDSGKASKAAFQTLKAAGSLLAVCLSKVLSTSARGSLLLRSFAMQRRRDRFDRPKSASARAYPVRPWVSWSPFFLFCSSSFQNMTWLR